MALAPDIRKWLSERFSRHVKFDEPMVRHTSFRVGGPADAFVTPETADQLVMLIDWASRREIPCLVIGDGTNLLVKDRGIRGIVVVMSACLNKIVQSEIKEDRVFVTAMAGAKMQSLCRFALAHGLKGMNFALGIPGTVGGGIMMNAGTSYGDVSGVLSSVRVLTPPGDIRTIEKAHLNFSYRRLAWPDDVDPRRQRIILEGRFCLCPADSQQLQTEAEAIMKNRRKMQPWWYPSAGCFFKNPAGGRSAGELIDLAGLKNRRIGGAAVASEHANFIINTGGASAADVIALMELIQETIQQKFNIRLEPEVKIVGT